MPNEKDDSPVMRLVLIAVLYFAVSMLGVEFVVLPEKIAVFWPAGGLLLGYLLTTKKRNWWNASLAAFCGNLLANVCHGHRADVSAGFAFVNSVEPVLIAYLMRRMRGLPMSLDRPVDVLIMFAAPSVVCAVTGLFGAGVVTIGLGAPSFLAVWKIWWLGDALGMILFAPIVLSLVRPVLHGKMQRMRRIEVGLIILLTAGFVWKAFGENHHEPMALLTAPYFVFPLMIWVTLRSDLQGTSVAIVVISLVGTWATLSRHHSVGTVEVSAADQVLATQLFVASVCLTSLMLAVVLRERQVSESRFKAIFHSQFQFVSLLSPDGVLMEANRTALAATGATESEVLGKPFWQTRWWIHDSAQQTRLQQAIANAAGGKREQFEASHPIVDGTLIWVDFALTPCQDEYGNVFMLIAEGHDITANKRSEIALRMSEERFKALAKNAPVGIFETDGVGNCLFVNARWCEMAGFSEEAALGPGWANALHPDDRVRVAREWEEAATSLREFSSEYRFLTPTGRITWLSGRSVALRNLTETVYGHLGTIVDITQRIRAEEMSRRLASIVESSEDAIISKNPDGIIESWNQGATNVFGYTADEIVGRPMTMLIPPDLLAEEDSILTRLRSGRKIDPMETTRVHKDGRLIQVSATVSPIRNLNGQITGASNVSRDVSRQKLAENALREAVEEKDVMLREIHHRVKNNLQVVSTLLDLQSEHTSDPATLKMFAESRGRVKSMAMIHERLYRSQDLARVDFHDYLSQLIEDLLRANRVSEDQIHVDLSIGIAPVPIDLAIPCGLLLNELISNCFKHAFRDHAEPRLAIEFHRLDEVFNILRVSDNGPGLPSDIDFRNTSSFGLQLVNTLIDQLGGSIELSTGVGTTISVRFPNGRTTK